MFTISEPACFTVSCATVDTTSDMTVDAIEGVPDEFPSLLLIQYIIKRKIPIMTRIGNPHTIHNKQIPPIPPPTPAPAPNAVPSPDP